MNLAKLASELAEISKFLEFIVAGAPPTALIPVVGIDKSGGKSAAKGQNKITWQFFSVVELDKAAEYALSLHKKNLDVYTVPSVFKSVPPQGERGGKDYVLGSTLLWVDKDYKDGNGTKAETLRQCSREPNPPTWVIDSGNGLHLYWKLDSFVSSIDDIENRNRFLCKRRFLADDCFSAEHLMRIPGLRNLKDPSNPKDVKTLSTDGGVYSISDFDILGADDTTETTGPIQEEEYDPEMLTRLSEELKDRIEEGPQGEDRSSNDWFVACALIENGYTPGQVLSIFLNPDFGVGEKARENISYAFRTIKKAAAEAKRRLALKPKALLQPVIDKMIFSDNKGNVHLDLPVQGYHIIRDACGVLEKQGYRFVFDDVDNVPYIISAQGEIIRATVNDRGYNGWVSHITLFTAESRAFKMFQTGIIAYIQEHGNHTQIKPWTHLDLDKSRFYVLTDHKRSARIAYVTAGDTRVVHGGNGVDNRILFPSEITAGNDLDIVEDLASVDLERTFQALFDLTHDYFAIIPEMKQFLCCYMLAIPIASAFVKHGMLPLLHMTGRAGQGKTEALKILSAFIHGSVNPESGTTVPGARSIASRDVLLPFDDYEELSKPMKEFILTSATGAVRHKADMTPGATAGVVGQKNHILIALSSIAALPTDTLRRRALRCEMSHEKYPTAKFNSMFKDKILRNRSVFWNAYMRFVLERVLGKFSITNYYELVEKVAAEITVSEFKPMSEFLALCWFIAQQLADIDPGRFGKYNANIRCISPWLNYFELLDTDALESHNELLGMYEHMFEAFLRELHMGETKNKILEGPRSPTGAAICATPLWMQGLYVEIPKDLPGDLPFDMQHTICVSGKMASWISTLGMLGNKAYFSGMANPVLQIFTATKNLAGIVTKLSDLQRLNVGPIKTSAIYRLGSSNLFVQFVYTASNKNPIVRMYYVLDKEQYVAPTAMLVTNNARDARESLAMRAATIRDRIQVGDYTAEESEEMIKLLQMYRESLAPTGGREGTKLD